MIHHSHDPLTQGTRLTKESRPWLDRMALIVVALFLLLAYSGRELRELPVEVVGLVSILPLISLITLFLLAGLLAPAGRRQVRVISFVTHVLISAFLFLPCWTGRLAPVQKTDFRLMEYNVQRLWGGEDPMQAAACVRSVVADEQPDLVVLAEITGRDAFALGEGLGFDCVQADYLGRGVNNQGGLALCINNQSHLRLISGEGSRFVDDDSWSYLFAEVQDGERVLNIMAVHLDPYRVASGDVWDRLGSREDVARSQGAQAVALVERVSKLKDPTIVVGDFNSPPQLALHTKMRRYLTDVWFEAGWGQGATATLLDLFPLRVDYIYHSNEMAAESATVGDAQCSDHKPLMVDLRWITDG